MTPHIDRYLLVESIRTIIGHCTCSQFNESINVFRKLKILTDHKHLGELSEGMLY